MYFPVYIAVYDADGDVVRCRWAESTQKECGAVCQNFPATLQQVNWSWVEGCMHVRICVVHTKWMTTVLSATLSLSLFHHWWRQLKAIPKLLKTVNLLAIILYVLYTYVCSVNEQSITPSFVAFVSWMYMVYCLVSVLRTAAHWHTMEEEGQVSTLLLFK